MLKTRRDAALAVAAELVPLEKEIDGAIIRNAHLQIALIEARRQAKLPLHAGQRGLEKVMEAAGQLLAARAALHEAHYDFKQVRIDMGLRVENFGDMGDTPTGYDAVEAPTLTVVAA